MKKYLDREAFIDFLSSLEEGKYTKLFTEDLDGEISEFSFLKTKFKDAEIILYNSPYCDNVGIIQDAGHYDWEDIAEGVYDDLILDGEYKVFIEV